MQKRWISVIAMAIGATLATTPVVAQKTPAKAQKAAAPAPNKIWIVAKSNFTGHCKVMMSVNKSKYGPPLGDPYETKKKAVSALKKLRKQGTCKT